MVPAASPPLGNMALVIHLHTARHCIFMAYFTVVLLFFSTVSEYGKTDSMKR